MWKTNFILSYTMGIALYSSSIEKKKNVQRKTKKS